MDLGTLVVIAGRALGLDAPAVLDLLDVGAAEAALAEAESPAAGDTPAERAAALLSALIRHRPLPRGNDQAAVLATVTFLAVNGWQVDLEPAEDTAAMVADLAAGRRSAAGLAAWLSPRISAYREPAVPLSPAKEAPMHGWLPNLRRNPRRKGDLMFRRFSPQAREVVISAQQEARALHHGFIGTEHILLGLLRDRDGVAGRALHVLGISPEAVREQVLDIIGEGQARAGRAHPAHAAEQEGPGTRGPGGRPPRSPVRGHRAHPARPGARGRRGGLARAAPARPHRPPGARPGPPAGEPGPAGAEPRHHPAWHPGLRHPDRAGPAGQGRGGGREGPRPGRGGAGEREGVAGRAGPPDRAVVGRGGHPHAGPRTRLAARRGEPAAGTAVAARHRARVSPEARVQPSKPEDPTQQSA